VIHGNLQPECNISRGDTSERDVYLALDDFGNLGRAWYETAEADTGNLGRNVAKQHLWHDFPPSVLHPNEPVPEQTA
jgi:hypothetical protein